MVRVAGWQTKLNEYLLQVQQEYRVSGIVWGKLDCVHYVANWVQLCTGEDPITEHRGKYTSHDDAFTRLIAYEGSFLEALTRRFGAPIAPSLAQRGDIAFNLDMNALGIFFTSGSRMQALFLGRDGFALHKAKECTHAFRV